MAKAPAYTSLSIWEDRWNQPTADELIASITEDRRSYIVELINHARSFETYEEEVIWAGTGWHWTLVFRMPGGDDTAQDTFCYIVPRHEEPLICIPLTKEVLEKLPIRRLNRLVRDELRLAKRGVAMNWAMWTPSMNTETEHLKDLLKRKHKLTHEESK